MRLWDLQGRKIISKYKHSNSPAAMVCATDGETVFVGESNGLVTGWRVKSGVQIETFKGHKGRINNLTMTDDGKYLISASSDLTLLVWNVPKK